MWTAFVGLVVAMLGLASPLDFSAVPGAVAAVSTIVGLALAVWALLSASHVIAEGKPQREHWSFSSRLASTAPTFTTGSGTTSNPSLPPVAFGGWSLTRCDCGAKGEEWIYEDAVFNRLLTLGRKIPVRIAPEAGATRMALYAAPWQQAAAYLFCLASDKALVNESKVSLSATPAPGIDGFEISKTSYLASCVTNEACHRELIEVPNPRAPVTASEFRYSFVDKQSPFRGGSSPSFDLLRYRHLSNHIGVTTLAITSDQYVVRFRQRADAQRSWGELVFGGSGSLDWADIERSSAPDDLLEIVKMGMAREFYEEAVWPRSGIRKRKDLRELAQQTKVIGAFLWPERGCKPEFLGLTKLNLPIHLIEPDSMEVGMDPATMARLEQASLRGLADLMRQLAPGESLGVSSAALLSRVDQLATASEHSGHPENWFATKLEKWAFGEVSSMRA